MTQEEVGLHIDMYSDVVCPWCYVGKRRFEAALALLDGGIRPRVRWQPFELNPTMPAEGMDRTTYLEAKFGDARTVESMLERVREAGKDSGITFAFGRMNKMPNTFDAHRLIWLANRDNRQDQVVEALFRGYFEEGADLSHRDTLAGLAEAGGLDRQLIRECLDSDLGAEPVRSEQRKGLRLGIRAVPHFRIEGQPGISGAQPPAVMAGWIHYAFAGNRAVG